MVYTINISDTSGNEGTVIADGGFYYTDNLNSINESNLVFSGSGELKRSLIGPGSIVKIYRNGTIEFQGLVDDIEYYDGGAMNVHASGYEVWLAKENGSYSSSPWTATASATIASAVIAESTYFTSGTIEAGTSIDFRATISDSLWNVLSNLISKTAQDIGIDYSDLEVDILDHKGSSTSVETLNAGIQIGDVRITSSYPIGNDIRVYGQSEGETRIQSDAAQGQDAMSKLTYGTIRYIIEDRTITTVAEANLLANAEVARLKDPRKIYQFDVLNPAKDWVSGDVLTLNAKSQGVSAEEVRIVQIKRGIKKDAEFLEVEVTNKEFSEKSKTRDEVVAELEKKYRDSTTYDSFQSEYTNQVNTTTSIGGVIDVYPSSLDLNGYVLFNALSLVNDSGNLLISADDVLELAGANGIVVDNEIDMSGNKIINTGTYYWSCTGDHFMSGNPDTDQITYGGDSGTVTAQANGINFNASVFLPNGAVVTSVIVYGNAGATAETWELERFTLSSAATATMASANIGTADSSISNATIDNNNYGYHFITTSLDTNDVIYGAKITYTI